MKGVSINWLKLETKTPDQLSIFKLVVHSKNYFIIWVDFRTILTTGENAMNVETFFCFGKWYSWISVNINKCDTFKSRKRSWNLDFFATPEWIIMGQICQHQFKDFSKIVVKQKLVLIIGAICWFFFVYCSIFCYQFMVTFFDLNDKNFSGINQLIRHRVV